MNKYILNVYLSKHYFTYDFKHVYKEFKAHLGSDYRYYLYTMIDEASRKRFTYSYLE